MRIQFESNDRCATMYSIHIQDGVCIGTNEVSWANAYEEGDYSFHINRSLQEVLEYAGIEKSFQEMILNNYVEFDEEGYFEFEDKLGSLIIFK